MKNHNGVTGNGRKSFKFYRKLDEILVHRPASVPAVLLDAGSSTLKADADENDSEEDVHSEQ